MSTENSGIQMGGVHNYIYFLIELRRMVLRILEKKHGKYWFVWAEKMCTFLDNANTVLYYLNYQMFRGILEEETFL